MFSRRWLTALLLVLAVGPTLVPKLDAAPDSRRFISATVRINRTPVPNASIELWVNGKRIRTGRTNEQGEYRFANLDIGRYEVRASAWVGGSKYTGSAIGKLTGTHLHVARVSLQR